MACEVFISFKRGRNDGGGLTRDYYLASDLHRTLVGNGVQVFFSEKDLSGSAFVREIYRALDQAKIIVVVGTRPEYIESEWVHSEWEFFLTAILGKRKSGGEIYTYLEGMSTNDLPPELYNRQSFDSGEKSKLVERILQNLGKTEANKEENPADAAAFSQPFQGKQEFSRETEAEQDSDNEPNGMEQQLYSLMSAHTPVTTLLGRILVTVLVLVLFFSWSILSIFIDQFTFVSAASIILGGVLLFITWKF